MFKVGDVVKIVHISERYTNPFVGRTGIITKAYNQDDPKNYQVELSPIPESTNPTLTLFEDEIMLAK